MRKIKVVVLLVRQLRHGFTKNAKVSPNLTVTLLHLGQLLYQPGLANARTRYPCLQVVLCWLFGLKTVLLVPSTHG